MKMSGAKAKSKAEISIERVVSGGGGGVGIRYSSQEMAINSYVCCTPTRCRQF